MSTATAPPPPETLAAIERAINLRDPSPVGGASGEVRFRCPLLGHKDVHPSARWCPKAHTWYCDVCKEGGGWLKLARLLGIERRTGTGARRRVADDVRQPSSETPYDYRKDGQLRFQVVRKDYPDGTKEFKQRQPKPGGGWIYNITGIERIPYRLDELRAAQPGSTVFVGEGEKVVDALVDLGLVATTNPMGAGNWDLDFDKYLAGFDVVILADNDPQGHKHAEKVAQALDWAIWHDSHAPTSVRVVHLPGLGDKEDAFDWIARGGTAEELAKIVAATPLWSRPAVQDSSQPAVLRFRTARDIATTTPEKPLWIADGIVAAGSITEIDGKIKASGKTTFITHLVSKALNGETFLDRPTTRTPVVYLTEQPPASFREALRRAGLLERDDLSVLFWSDTIGVEWVDVVAAARVEAKRIGARLIVVDTLGQFTGLRGDAENNAGAAMEAIEPLQQAAAVDGLAVVILRHDRKGGGEVGESSRGSSAFAGAVDVVLQLRRGDGNTRPSIRVLSSLSRFDETPDQIVIELTEDGYQVLGNETAVAAQEAREALLDAAPESEEAALSTDDIIAVAKVRKTVGKQQLAELVKEKKLVQVGEGKRGNSYRYYAPKGDEGDDEDSEKHSAASPVVAAERKESAARQDATEPEIHSAAIKREVAAERNGRLGAEAASSVAASGRTWRDATPGDALPVSEIHSAATTPLMAAEGFFDAESTVGECASCGAVIGSGRLCWECR